VNIIELLGEAARSVGIKVFASLMLLKSVTMIRYLNGLPGVPNIPHDYLKQMMKSPVKQQAGMEIAAEFLKEVEKHCDGAVLIALGWGSRLPEFLSLIGR
jgi:5,10-methylenetetrahydrofolate reductase